MVAATHLTWPSLDTPLDDSDAWVGAITVSSDLNDPSTTCKLTVSDNSISTYTTLADFIGYHDHQSKHFNCKRCGAPNQIDVCEYCGSSAED